MRESGAAGSPAVVRTDASGAHHRVHDTGGTVATDLVHGFAVHAGHSAGGGHDADPNGSSDPRGQGDAGGDGGASSVPFAALADAGRAVAATASTALAAPAAAAQQPGSGAASVAAQIGMVLTPLRKGADGVHRMTIHLEPGELGAVSIVAEVRGGAVAVQLQAGSDAGRAALQAALPDLRQDLQQAGFGGCDLDLHQQSSPQGNQPQHFSGWQPEGRSQQRAPERRRETPDEGTRRVADDAGGALDLRV
ncbi:flagellar hook-length control protein FliK [Dactylosporangium sucinum]